MIDSRDAPVEREPSTDRPDADPWNDALLAATLLAIDPAGLGGVSLRARPGPARDRWLAFLKGLLPSDMPMRRVPASTADDRLLGGLDLTATLAAGRPVAQRGLLAETHGGILQLAMAERISAGTAGRIAAVLDSGSVTVEREGLALVHDARFGVVALDEGVEDEERPPVALTDRLAFSVDLSGVANTIEFHRHCFVAGAPRHDGGDDAACITKAREILGAVEPTAADIEALCGVAAAFGIDSMRAPILALRVALAHAALAGRLRLDDSDLQAAARLVLAPRATRLPTTDQQDAPPPPPPPPDPDQAQKPDDEDNQTDAPPQDLLMEATRAALPPGLLALLLGGAAPRRQAPESGRAGEARRASQRGRPIGAVAGELKSGTRLALVETLRAAAPWQRLRLAGTAAPQSRILVRREDVRIKRFAHRSATTTIFAVDASGSSAMNRMAEAKGAVELLLADCYVRRDQVALIAFRGQGAEVLLPPTRSLARAKRSLAGLPGGGGTPLASGLEAAADLADGIRRRGQKAVLVVLTDGRANIARDGSHGRPQGEQDALTAARSIAAANLPTILVDTSPRPQRQAEALARAMGARYMPLPSADARVLSAAVKIASPSN